MAILVLRVRHLGERPPARGYVIVSTVVPAVFMLWASGTVLEAVLFADEADAAGKKKKKRQ